MLASNSIGVLPIAGVDWCVALLGRWCLYCDHGKFADASRMVRHQGAQWCKTGNVDCAGLVGVRDQPEPFGFWCNNEILSRSFKSMAWSLAILCHPLNEEFGLRVSLDLFHTLLKLLGKFFLWDSHPHQNIQEQIEHLKKCYIHFP